MNSVVNFNTNGSWDELCDAVAKPPPVTLMSHVRVPLHVPAVLLLIQFPANASEKEAGDGPGAWAPATLMGDLGGVPGFGLAQP